MLFYFIERYVPGMTINRGKFVVFTNKTLTNGIWLLFSNRAKSRSSLNPFTHVLRSCSLQNDESMKIYEKRMFIHVKYILTHICMNPQYFWEI